MAKVDYSIRNLRKETGMSQEVFAEFFYMPVRTIQNWETESDSRRTPPEYLVKLMVYKLKKEGLL